MKKCLCLLMAILIFSTNCVCLASDSRNLTVKNTDMYVSEIRLLDGFDAPGAGYIEFTPLELEGGSGVVFRYLDMQNHYLVKFNDNTDKLTLNKKLMNSTYTTIASAAYTPDMPILIEYYQNNIKLSQNDTVLIDLESESKYLGGKAGVWSLNGKASVEFIKCEKIEIAGNGGEDSEFKETIYVSPDGNDLNKGTLENPIKTFDKALDLVKKGVATDVIFREGKYAISSVQRLNTIIGTKNRKITFKGAEGETVVFNSGNVVLRNDSFKPVNSEKILSMLPENSRDKVMQVDLTEYGLKSKDVTMVKPRGKATPKIKLFVNAKEQTMSRFPKVGFNRFGRIINEGGIAYINETEGTNNFTNPIFEVNEIEALSWTKNTNNIFIEGNFKTEYHTEDNVLAKVDPDRGTLEIQGETMYGVREGCKWAAVNVLEQLSNPGEFVIDQSSAVLYYYPLDVLDETDEIELVIPNDSYFLLEACEYVSFDNIHFDKFSAKDVFGIWGCNYITINNCVFSNILQNAIKIDSENVSITNCEFNTLGGDVLREATLGERDSLTDGNLVFKNNLVRNIGLLNGSGTMGLYILNTVGADISNNIMTGSDSALVNYKGNDIKIKYNELYNAVRNASDAGVVYTGRDMAAYGCEASYNYIHDYGNDNFPDASFYMSGIFVDDAGSGQTFKHNIIVPNKKEKTITIKIGGGQDCITEDNIFVGAGMGYRIEDRLYYSKYDAHSYDAIKNIKSDGIYGFVYNQIWTDKYPAPSRIISELEDGKFYYPKRNTMQNNVVIGCDTVSEYGAINDKGDNIIKNNKITDDTSIFVNLSKQDYRIKNSAKKELGLSDGVLDENFQMDLIGIQGEIKTHFDKAFNLTAPSNGATGVIPENIYMSWENSYYSDVYTIEIATDSDFKNIIHSDNTYDNKYIFTKAEKGKVYYWRVKAENLSFKMADKWENSNGIYKFSTATKVKAKTEVLEKRLIDLEKIKNSLTDIGPEIGQYREGTKEDLEKIINKAKGIMKDRTSTQVIIDEQVKIINNLLNSYTSYKNMGYKNFEQTSVEGWIAGEKKGYVTIDGDDTIIESTSTQNILTNELLPENEILCFSTMVEDLDKDWVSYGIRVQATTGACWDGNTIYVVIKKEQIELQRSGTILATVPNTNLFEEEKWHEVQFGAINTNVGVEIIFNIDGKMIFDMIDRDNPVWVAGRFGVKTPNYKDEDLKIVPVKVHIKPSSNIPEGIYNVPEEILNATGSIEYYTTASEEYKEYGNFSDSELAGYENSQMRTSDESNATASWVVYGEGLKNYRISYWNMPDENGDKNVTVSFENFGTDYKTHIDLSNGKEGFISLGVFKFITENVSIGNLAINFVGSGKGNLNVSAIKVEPVDENLTAYSELFAQIVVDGTIMKNGSNKAFNMSDTIGEINTTVENTELAYIPIRPILDTANYRVLWDNSTSSATITNDSNLFVIKNGSNIINVNGSDVVIDAAAKVKDGMLCVSAETLKHLGFDVVFDEENEYIYIAEKINTFLIKDTHIKALDELFK